MPLLDIKDFLKHKLGYYTIYKIKKSSGKTRTIHAPNAALKGFQRGFLDATYPYIEHSLEDSVIGFRPGKSVLTNASHHLNKKIILNIDIKDFFPSIPREWLLYRIERLLAKNRTKNLLIKNNLNLTSNEVFELLTIDQRLPQGSPCSPALANLYLSEKGFDAKMRGLLGWEYTRYADDLTFSSNLHDSVDYVRTQVIPIVYAGLYEIGMIPSLHKTKIKLNSQRQLVTGILVNNENTRISKNYLNELKCEYLENGENDKTRGMMSYIKSVNPNQFDKLSSFFEKL